MRNAAGALVDYTPIKVEINTAVQICARSCNLLFTVVEGLVEARIRFPKVTKKVVEMHSNFFL